ncbi:MAG TPA: hypothetical protein VF395_11285 [Polyangiaceae bacterium]
MGWPWRGAAQVKSCRQIDIARSSSPELPRVPCRAERLDQPGGRERSIYRQLSSALAAGLCCFSARARAEVQVSQPTEPLEQPIRVQYSAPDGCPDSLSFFLHVRARTQRVRLAAPGELAAVVSVRIATELMHTVGTLEMPDEHGAPFVRRVEAESCDEVALALSLVLALAYDPDALVSFSAGPAAPLEVPSPRPPSPLRYPPAPAPEPQTLPLASPFGLATGVSAFLMSGLAPTPTPIFGPFIEYGIARDGGFTPKVSAALFVAPDRDVTMSASGRTVTLQFFGARLTGCPVSVELLTPDLALSPCLAFDAGRILGTGGGSVDGSRAGGIFWLSASGLAKVRWKIVDPLFVELEGGGGLTLIHGGFDLQGPHETVHTIPAGFGLAGFGVGAHFP